ncbi:GntR family transcriptional regulator [Mycolicibacterium neoaurum]|nr:GntR family transcriptional regulator [Mycolicibacterium neoaurum VKM Ac-1815D]AMO07974.1 GntR family transcriptional regulator [Mycolicibacterium neoaurum]KJQ49984.1 GntR family transcriptional regulator [Mycolicibacterium neoaurum]KUM07718.1 GntR family transcriptional regulator [Mycolicibacterium neoaurum]
MNRRPKRSERTQRTRMNAPAKLGPARRREQLSDEVAGYLRVAIMSGTLRPGTFVRLDETAAQLGVSITPVREALRTLRGEGMVQLEPHRGHMVSPFTRDDIADIFWLQGAIAAELAATAARRATDADIDELERLTEDLDAAVRGGEVEPIARAEFHFHRAFNRTTNRMKLAWFLLHAARYLPPHIYASDPTWGQDAVVNHRQLTAAMRRREVDEVVRLTRSQFDDGARRLTSLLDSLGLWT